MSNTLSYSPINLPWKQGYSYLLVKHKGIIVTRTYQLFQTNFLVQMTQPFIYSSNPICLLHNLSLQLFTKVWKFLESREVETVTTTCV